MKAYFDELVVKYNSKEFIESDPISIPHRFSKKQDIEIAALLSAILSWGQRKTIINSANKLMGCMDNDPYDFIMGASPSELDFAKDFKHRTFNYSDYLSFVGFFREVYSRYDSLEDIISNVDNPVENLIEKMAVLFESSELYLARSSKHFSRPSKGSACKRINMFLRWMVRKDEMGVDFGIWKNLSPKDLLIPLDVHVFNGAKAFGLINRNIPDWKCVIELTETLKKWDFEDPIKYDFALFGLGVNHKINTRAIL